MAKLVDETLEAWRDAERLLVEVPLADKDRQAVQDAVTALRSAYHRLTTQRESEQSTAAIAQQARRHARTVRRIRQHLSG